MYKYRSEIPNRTQIAAIGLEVEPGEEFESPEPLIHPELVPINEEAIEFAVKMEERPGLVRISTDDTAEAQDAADVVARPEE